MTTTGYNYFFCHYHYHRHFNEYWGTLLQRYILMYCNNRDFKKHLNSICLMRWSYATWDSSTFMPVNLYELARYYYRNVYFHRYQKMIYCSDVCFYTSIDQYRTQHRVVCRMMPRTAPSVRITN